jgi:50S ribosomal protein L16 3-hydroxylase
VLGNVSTEDFLANYWQQKVLLVRQALPHYIAGLSADELAGLSLEEEVESRLILEHTHNRSWVARHGPFHETDFAQLPATHWTLLVQAVDLWVPQVKALLERFDFLPSWRLDDIMVSYAPPGGSVGPHFDHYDVFLLQVSGTRRWQVGDKSNNDAVLIADADLKILADFEVRQEWLLNPGDMLYLPPRVAHWGVAETACMTYSIGFRAPTVADLLNDLAVELTVNGRDQHITDPPLTPAMAGDTITPEFIQATKRQIAATLNDDALIADWLARFMTMPKYPELVDITGEKRVAKLGKQRYVNGDLED